MQGPGRHGSTTGTAHSRRRPSSMQGGWAAFRLALALRGREWQEPDLALVLGSRERAASTGRQRPGKPARRVGTFSWACRGGAYRGRNSRFCAAWKAAARHCFRPRAGAPLVAVRDPKRTFFSRRAPSTTGTCNQPMSLAASALDSDAMPRASSSFASITDTTSSAPSIVERRSSVVFTGT